MLQAFLMRYLKASSRSTLINLHRESQNKFKTMEIDEESVSWCLEELADRDYIQKNEYDGTYEYLPG